GTRAGRRLRHGCRKRAWLARRTAARGTRRVPPAGRGAPRAAGHVLCARPRPEPVRRRPSVAGGRRDRAVTVCDDAGSGPPVILKRAPDCDTFWKGAEADRDLTHA